MTPEDEEELLTRVSELEVRCEELSRRISSEVDDLAQRVERYKREGEQHRTVYQVHHHEVTDTHYGARTSTPR